MSGIHVHFHCSNLYYNLIILIRRINWHSLNEDINECIPDENKNVLPHPLYYVGTTRHDYQMASFVLGKNSVTIQEMHAVFPPNCGDNKDTHTDIGISRVGSIG